jgi:hypothetical protein
MKKFSILFSLMFLIGLTGFVTTQTFKANPIREKNVASISAEEASYYAEIDQYYEQTFQTSDIENTDKIETVYVYDIKGNLVQKLSASGDEPINLDNLSQGAELLMKEGLDTYYIIL